MDCEALHREVALMLFEGREDDYCDFKQCYHDNKASLLHDIICMANNLSGKDGYIIFGIEDKTMKVMGVENDANRRNQQQFVDFLKGKFFFRYTTKDRITHSAHPRARN